ncbi:MAG: hypothetical protein ACO1SX_15205, partial [Actinomycetota bacterium]
GRVFAAETSLFTGSMMLSSLATSRTLDLQQATVPQVTLALGVTAFLVGAGWVLYLLRGRLTEAQPALAAEPAGD